MRISCLIENSACAGFESEHGLSLWIEARGRRLLFDAGRSGAFAENAARLGIDLAGPRPRCSRTGTTTTAAAWSASSS